MNKLFILFGLAISQFSPTKVSIAIFLPLKFELKSNPKIYLIWMEFS